MMKLSEHLVLLYCRKRLS